MGTRVEESRGHQSAETNDRWNEQHAETGSVSAFKKKDQRDQERTDGGARLIERLV